MLKQDAFKVATLSLLLSAAQLFPLPASDVENYTSIQKSSPLDPADEAPPAYHNIDVRTYHSRSFN